MRVAILGNSGSGKSTLARALSAAAGVPVLDLDTVAWEPDQAAVPRDEALARDDVHAFCRRNDAWVVEGCYATLIKAALAHGPRLILLDPGLDACLANCRARPWEPHKYPSKDAQDANLPHLLAWVAEYYTRTGPMSLAAHQACFAAYGGAKRALRSLPKAGEPDLELLAWARSREPVPGG
jgi:adenylate kinase family enzyme